jgi:hypothetical protein
MIRPAITDSLRLLLASAVAIGALSACSDATDPGNDLLADLNEMAIYGAMVEELTLFNHTAEANANLRLALGSAIPPAEPIPPELFGHTLKYDQDTGGWIAESVPAVPDHVLRVSWYQLSGSSVAVPTVDRGFIELTQRADPELARLDVRAVRTDNAPTTLADYTARFGETSTATTLTRAFEAAGTVSDGERQLAFEIREAETEPLGNGEGTNSVRLALSNARLAYHVVLDEARDPQTGAMTVTLAARVTVEGVESRVDLTLEEAAGGAVNGAGSLHHGGRKIADVAVSGTSTSPRWTFTRPDGSTYTGNQERRLGDLISIMLIPLSVAGQYFS